MPIYLLSTMNPPKGDINIIQQMFVKFFKGYYMMFPCLFLLNYDGILGYLLIHYRVLKCGTQVVEVKVKKYINNNEWDIDK
ncbi:hypothetical protein H5410_060913 [Solanum commersonii]|uniref:Uncharacterized protein n=1 Tax=Solanum commersonii TaxID=4109 RepID=A0A9J5W6A7_SOLCO|nr:hypothetical protein H5410_060913 [Solanum commersonii]